MNRRPEVVVVGAGPVGLSVALGLARRRRRVLVLEKDPGTAERSRAPAIWPGTQEVLDDLGVHGRFLGRGISHSRLALHDADRGGTLLDLSLESLGSRTRHPRLLIVPQSVTERLLLDALHEEESAEIVFSAEVASVVDVTDTDERVETGVDVVYRREGHHRTVRCDAAVGCDGAHSVVRESLGVDFDGETYRTRAALADVEMTGGDDLPSPRLTTRAGLVVAIRIDDGLWRLILPLSSDEGRFLDDRIEHAVPRLFPGIRMGDVDVVWKSEFRLHRRVAAHFVRGRIALAGDAAHLNSPVGGQGMNAGIQDAALLVEALDRELSRTRPFAAGGPLDGYGEARRRAIAEGVNAFTDILTRLLLFREGRFVRFFFAFARAILSIPPIRRRILERVAMIDG